MQVHLYYSLDSSDYVGLVGHCLCVSVSQSDKELDLALTAILGKVHGVKTSLGTFVGKMEHDHQLKW